MKNFTRYYCFKIVYIDNKFEAIKNILFILMYKYIIIMCEYAYFLYIKIKVKIIPTLIYDSVFEFNNKKIVTL